MGRAHAITLATLSGNDRLLRGDFREASVTLALGRLARLMRSLERELAEAIDPGRADETAPAATAFRDPPSKIMESKDMERLAIYGCGGFGRELLPIARSGSLNYKDIIFISDDDREIGTVVNGVDVISFDDLISLSHSDRQVVVAVGSPQGRKTLVQKCEKAGLRFGSLTASTHKSFETAVVGSGAVFCDFSICNVNTNVGNHFQCNIYSYIGHDCVIGDFVTFAPKVACNGRVVIEDDVYVGAGALLREGSPGKPLRVGRGAVIGMGAVVTKDVPAGFTVVGNPARPLVKNATA